MVAVELGNGKTVMVKLEDWLNMTDEQFQDLIAKNDGYEIDDPFHKTVDKIREIKSWDDAEVLPDLLPKIPEELSEDEIKKINRDANGS